MRLPNSISFFCVAALSLFSASCADLALKQSLAPQLEEARTMHSTMQSEWAAVDAVLAQTEGMLTTFASQARASSGVNYKLIGQAITSSVDAALVGDVNAVQATAYTSALLVTALEASDTALQSDVDAVFQSGRAIYSQLRVGIPDSIASLVAQAGESAGSMALLKGKGVSKLSFAKSNPLMRADDMQSLRNEQTSLDQEILNMSTLATQIGSQAVARGARVSAALSTFLATLNIAND